MVVGCVLFWYLFVWISFRFVGICRGVGGGFVVVFSIGDSVELVFLGFVGGV